MRCPALTGVCFEQIWKVRRLIRRYYGKYSDV